MTDASVLLAFDTSTQALAVALQHGPRSWLHNGEGGAAASASLLPLVRSMVAQAGLRLEQMDAIAFGRGPGAFTGLRTSCAVAQGLALGLSRPVLAIDSLLLVAEQARAGAAPGQVREVGVVMDARMGEVYAARWLWTGTDWQAIADAGLYDPAALAAEWGTAPPATCTGSGRSLVEPALRDRGGVTQWLPEGDDRAGALLALARQAWRHGQAVDAALALPTYVRDKVAKTTAEREAERTAPAR